MSALKTWILSLGVVFLLAACSNDSANPGNIANAGDDASSASKSAGSADGKTIVKPGDKIVINGGKDTIVVADAEGSLYYSSGVFCWTDGCEAKLSSSSKGSSSASNSKSSSSTTKSSSSSAKSSSSSAPPVPPTVTENEMTDNRDGVKYKIEKIGDVTWMAENLRFKPSSGTYCDATVEVTVKKEGPGGGEGPGGAGGPGAQQAEEETITVNVCEQYGMFYTSLSVATAACPYGWRLPTKDEVLAALEAKPGTWWTLGGRFNLENSAYEKAETEGRLWIQTTSDEKNCLQIMKSGENNVTTDYLYAGAGKRAFHARCVMDGSN